jgi:glycosyltransferase involved in cell wall biosynthesis
LVHFGSDSECALTSGGNGCVRNEVIHIRRCIEHLVDSGLEVYLIGNESTDGTREIASEFLGRGLIGIENLPWAMEFSLSDQLRAKQRVFAALDHDWIVHADAGDQVSKGYR